MKKTGGVLMVAALAGLIGILTQGCQQPAPAPVPAPTPVPAPPSPFPDAAARGLIDAGRQFPGAAICESEPHPLLMRLAAEHARYMADKRQLGHQGFSRRSQEIRAAGLGRAAEICAESWRWQREDTPLELGEEMFRSWRSSRGHWKTASKRHRWFGAGMARGENGVWYACIIGVD
jgi:hypothetical protein